MNSYKVVVVGDGGVGKSAYIHRYLTGEFLKKYEPTNQLKITEMPIETSCGVITLKVLSLSVHLLDDLFERVIESFLISHFIFFSLFSNQ